MYPSPQRMRKGNGGIPKPVSESKYEKVFERVSFETANGGKEERLPIGYNSPLWPVGLRANRLLRGAHPWLIMEKKVFIANSFSVCFGALPIRGSGLA